MGKSSDDDNIELSERVKDANKVDEVNEEKGVETNVRETRKSGRNTKKEQGDKESTENPPNKKDSDKNDDTDEEKHEQKSSLKPLNGNPEKESIIDTTSTTEIEHQTINDVSLSGIIDALNQSLDKGVCGTSLKDMDLPASLLDSPTPKEKMMAKELLMEELDKVKSYEAQKNAKSKKPEDEVDNSSTLNAKDKGSVSSSEDEKLAQYRQSNYQESSSEEVSDKKKDQAAKSSPMTTRSKAGPLSRKAGPASSKRAGPASLKRPGPMSRTKKNNSDSKSSSNTEIKSNASETETDTAIETSAELPLFSPSTKSDENKDTALIKHSEKDAERNRHSEEFEPPSSKSPSAKLNKQSSVKTSSDEKESDKSIEDVSRLSVDSPSEEYNANTCTPSAKYTEKRMTENSETEGEADLSFSALDCLPLHTPPSKPVNKTSSNNEKKEEKNS